MMICKETIEQLGLYLDGGLPSSVHAELESHLETCDSCRAEYELIKNMVEELTSSSKTSVPESLWTSIERRLESETQIMTQVESSQQRVFKVRPLLLRPAPIALAATIFLAVGLSIFGPAGMESTAQASSVDFSVLLNALPVDAHKAFRKFLLLYDAREATPRQARRYAPELNYNVPEILPGGFHLKAVYLLRFGELAGIAATYDRDGEFLGAVFHPPVDKENFGPHRDYPCVIGKHEGHKVSVGEWKLIHLTDPTTCHCILSKLDEQTELPRIMTAVAPGLSITDNQHTH